VAVADHAAIMVHGHIEQQGTPSDMAEAALGSYLG
jgi:ABC-type Fe3+/spermidine/putrescine transport system ATPase subunit